MGIPALVYAGDADFICNYLGNKAWTLKLEWEGEESFNGAEEHSWKRSGTSYGRVGLTFFAGVRRWAHGSADQPKIALI
jgi:cathepsin A (carboxypeptidase C)